MTERDDVDVVSVRVSVDVSDVDFSEHPAWASDLDVDVLMADRGRVPEWAGEVLEYHVDVITTEGRGTGSAGTYERAVRAAQRDARL